MPMHKKIIGLLVLISVTAQSDAMHFLRAAMRGMPNAIARSANRSALFMRASIRPTVIRSQIRTLSSGHHWLKPRFPRSILRSAGLLLPVSAFGAAYWQNKKQPTPELWALRAEGHEVPRKEMIDAFVRDCTTYASLNEQIPAHSKNDQSARIATYNVHNWRDPYGAKNFDRIVETIKTINADVLI